MSKFPDFNFIQIPYPILYNDELNDAEKLIYGQILALSAKKPCSANNMYFSKALNKDKNTVSRNINNLEKKGYITIESKSNFRRTLHIVNEKLKDFDREAFFNRSDLKETSSKINRSISKNDDDHHQKLTKNIIKNDEHNKSYNKQTNKKINKKADEQVHQRHYFSKEYFDKILQREKINEYDLIDFFTYKEFYFKTVETLKELLNEIRCKQEDLFELVLRNIDNHLDYDYYFKSFSVFIFDIAESALNYDDLYEYEKSIGFKEGEESTVNFFEKAFIKFVDVYELKKKLRDPLYDLE